MGCTVQLLLLLSFVAAVKEGSRCVAQAGLKLAIPLLLCPSVVISDTQHMPGSTVLVLLLEALGRMKRQTLKNLVPSFQTSPLGTSCVIWGQVSFMSRSQQFCL